ncbi:MAG: histidine phosphatase family protein [Pyrinomonadaceae bacterium]
MNQTVYLVRHCQAAGQEPDAPLTEEGDRQAVALAERLSHITINRIISSPFLRARQSIQPLANRLALTIEMDDRLIERVLSSAQHDDWRERLAQTFVDPDLSFEGGESSRAAMARGVAVVDDAIRHDATGTILVTHGNLMTLILKHFDDQIGYSEWEKLTNPDVYCVKFNSGGAVVERLAQ